MAEPSPLELITATQAAPVKTSSATSSAVADAVRWIDDTLAADAARCLAAALPTDGVRALT